MLRATAAALAFALAYPTLASAQTPASQAGTKVVMLGTGNPNADPDRYGPAVAVVVDGQSYIVDAGVGVVRRAAAAAERSGLSALAAPNLTRAFITHLHSDHTLGLPDLLLSPWVLERPSALQLWGPRGLKAMTDHLLGAYAEDIRVRTTGGEPKHGSDPRAAQAHEVQPGDIYRDEHVTVTAFAVKHGDWDQAFGYRFTTRDRTIVVSGDTGPDSHIEEQCHGCDVLVHEVYSEAGFAKRSADWQAYHARYHTSTSQLTAIAKQSRPKLLVLYHQLIWSSTEEALVAEITSRYGGRVVSAHDLDIY